jgi:hypothetical protein
MLPSSADTLPEESMGVWKCDFRFTDLESSRKSKTALYVSIATTNLVVI